MTTQVDPTTGVTVVLEGRPRQTWSQPGRAEWRLEHIWPTPQERRGVLRVFRSGEPLLVIQSSPGETIDLFDEELTKPRSVTEYITDCQQGITTLFVPSLDWLPTRIANAASQFIQEQMQLHAAEGTMSAILTPRLGRRKNLRVLHLETRSTASLTPECVQELANLAFPNVRNHDRAHTHRAT